MEDTPSFKAIRVIVRILAYLESSFRQKAGLSLHESRAPHFSVPPSLSAPLTGSGSPRCTFPFIYKGRSYSSCTTVGRRDRKLWCATTDSYAKDGRWRFCSPMGPDSLPCTFPFKYKGKSYSACTRDGSTDKQLWCATTSDYDKDGKWKFCTQKGESLSSVSRCLERVAAENAQTQDRLPANRADTPKLRGYSIIRFTKPVITEHAWITRLVLPWNTDNPLNISAPVYHSGQLNFMV
ncbi:matrix metalloproteinase-9-like [Chelonia mydas]|uniref:matrix metalloproteinase-9-like n=1 Tax=Chelonia mydas TaxID=8469 RepID=UPI001CA92032|nr:matrix metalloproteinase-9-like [Chelonia mydas]